MASLQERFSSVWGQSQGSKLQNSTDRKTSSQPELNCCVYVQSPLMFLGTAEAKTQLDTSETDQFGDTDKYAHFASKDYTNFVPLFTLYLVLKAALDRKNKKKKSRDSPAHANPED